MAAIDPCAERLPRPTPADPPSPISEPRKVLVVGLDDFNRERLQSIRDAGSYAFHAALALERIQAEEILTGRRCTICGCVREGRIRTYGLIDSIHDPESSSFFRYRYPSRLPEEVHARIVRISEDVIAAAGLDDTPFNIESFWDEERDAIGLREVNARLSRFHSCLLEQVDGASHHQVLVELALDNPPEVPRGEGPHLLCNKLRLRAFGDGEDQVLERYRDAVELPGIEIGEVARGIAPLLPTGSR